MGGWTRPSTSSVLRMKQGHPSTLQECHALCSSLHRDGMVGELLLLLRGMALRGARQRALDSIAGAGAGKASQLPMDIPRLREPPRPLPMPMPLPPPPPNIPALVIQGTELPDGVEVQDPDRQQIKKKGRPKKSVLKRGAPHLQSGIERRGLPAKRAKSMA